MFNAAIAPTNPSHRSSPSAAEQLLSSLLEGVAMGDRGCLKDVYHITSKRLFSLLVRMVKRHDVAEDVLQEVYITIWRKAHLFAVSRGQAMPWLYAIARRKAIDRLRSSDREGVGLTADAASTEDTRQRDWVWVDPELAITVNRSLDALPSHVNTALRLCYTAGLTHDEVAAVMAVPLGTAKSWVRRGLADLRESLAVCVNA